MIIKNQLYKHILINVQIIICRVNEHLFDFSPSYKEIIYH